MAEILLRCGERVRVKAAAEEVERRLGTVTEYTSTEGHTMDPGRVAGYLRSPGYVQFEPADEGFPPASREPVRINVMAVEAIFP